MPGLRPHPFGLILIFLPHGRIFHPFDIWYTIQHGSGAAISGNMPTGRDAVADGRG
jgi:hypothetical protein